MIIFVGSTNPVKLSAVKQAASSTYPDVVVTGFEVKSQVSEQPMTDDETMTGSINRAKAALTEGLKQHKKLALKTGSNSDPTDNILGVGLEGGVFIADTGEVWSTVWVAAVDQQSKIYVANGARFPLPEIIAKRLRQGQELGPVMQQLTGIYDVRKKQGMFGVVTQGFIDRTEAYKSIVKCALGQWYGRDWDITLK